MATTALKRALAGLLVVAPVTFIASVTRHVVGAESALMPSDDPTVLLSLPTPRQASGSIDGTTVTDRIAGAQNRCISAFADTPGIHLIASFPVKSAEAGKVRVASNVEVRSITPRGEWVALCFVDGRFGLVGATDSATARELGRAAYVIDDSMQAALVAYGQQRDVYVAPPILTDQPVPTPERHSYKSVPVTTAVAQSSGSAPPATRLSPDVDEEQARDAIKGAVLPSYDSDGAASVGTPSQPVIATSVPGSAK